MGFRVFSAFSALKIISGARFFAYFFSDGKSMKANSGFHAKILNRIKIVSYIVYV